MTKEKEQWYKSRRVWATIIATIGSVLILFVEIPYVDKIVAACGIIAGTLSGTSFITPKIK